ncbi:Uncharacterised protein [Klebsiella pneumoniae]|uniref:Uncharacterized protein n=1 Tax=Klebsiella pneumoniae TaxID=573 RepID=A0A2X3EZ17_KLEPN|nr:Uncharacterised protein [Klebsiella pneumoniae]
MPDESMPDRWSFQCCSPERCIPTGRNGQLVVDLGFAFHAYTHVGLVAVDALVVREVVQTVNFTVQV